MKGAESVDILDDRVGLEDSVIGPMAPSCRKAKDSRGRWAFGALDGVPGALGGDEGRLSSTTSVLVEGEEETGACCDPSSSGRKGRNPSAIALAP